MRDCFESFEVQFSESHKQETFGLYSERKTGAEDLAAH